MNKKCAKNCIIIRRTDRNLKRLLWKIQAVKEEIEDRPAIIGYYGTLTVYRGTIDSDWIFIMETGDGCKHCTKHHGIGIIKAKKF